MPIQRIVNGVPEIVTSNERYALVYIPKDDENGDPFVVLIGFSDDFDELHMTRVNLVDLGYMKYEHFKILDLLGDESYAM